MFLRVCFLILFLLTSSLGASHADAPVNILASSNNKFVLPILLKSFYKKYPDTRVVIQYGATGDLTNSILEGVNYDLFLAADMKFPQKIYKAGLAVSQPIEYARGSLILFVPADKTLKQRKLKLLKDEKIKFITIANKKTAPYGMAAIEALKNADLFKMLGSKIRYSTDISTAITNVVWYDDAGFLSKSALDSLPSAYKEEGVNWIEIDDELYSPIIQGYVVSKNGAKNINVRKFIKFLLSDDARVIYKAYGYR